MWPIPQSVTHFSTFTTGIWSEICFGYTFCLFLWIYQLLQQCLKYTTVHSWANTRSSHFWRTRAYMEYLTIFTAGRTFFDFHDGYLVYNLFWAYIFDVPMDFSAYTSVPKTYFSPQLGKHPFLTFLRTNAYREYLAIFTASRTFFEFDDKYLVYNLFWPYIV